MNNDKLVWEKVQMPENLQKYGNYFYTSFDKEVLLATDDAGFVEEKHRRSRLEYLYKHGVLDKVQEENGDIRYRAAPFLTRMNSFIVHEKSYWISLPQEIRDEVNKFCMDPIPWTNERAARYKKKGLYETVLPLEEAVKVLEEHTGNYYYVAECNCNNYMMNCERDKMEVCIQFPYEEQGINSLFERGISKRITKQEAIEALRHADSEGLIHKLGATKQKYCNCCRDCCIFHISKECEDKLKGTYLQIPYVICVDEEKCIGCEKCIPKCQFSALTLDGNKMKVDENECWGCGVCMAACPVGALSVHKR